MAKIRGKNPGPDFLGIGVARSGTTTAYKVLKSHPQIFMPEKKELHFFTFAQQAYEYQPQVIALMTEKYLEMFSLKGLRLAGEISPSYFYFPGAAEKIHTFNPNLKIFCILRSPVDRALSDYYYSGLDKKIAPDEFFSQGINDLQRNELVLKPFSPSAVLYKGFYRRHVTSYVQQFSPDQLLILPFTGLRDDAEKFFNALFSFLNIKPQLENISVNENGAKYPRQANHENARAMLTEFYRDEISFYEEIVNGH